MPLQIADIRLTSPVLLAPMAGITDLPFRHVVAGFGAGLVVSEMVASQEVVQGRPLARARAELGLGDAATAVQIAGREAHWMARAAAWAAGNGARIIDINMGCPAKKVTGGLSGSALMRDPDHAIRLIEAVVAAVDVPVTLKMRLGWDDGSHTAGTLAQRAAEAGVRMVTVHGRTRCQFYTGAADWAAIAPVRAGLRAAVDIPLIANGDVVDLAAARAALAAAGADGVMVGRGAQGRPWLLAQIAAGLEGRAGPQTPTGEALVDLVLAHHAAMLSFYGADLGVRMARKHLGWYLDAAGADRAARAEAVTLTAPARLPPLLRAAFGAAQGDARVAA